MAIYGDIWAHILPYNAPPVFFVVLSAYPLCCFLLLHSIVIAAMFSRLTTLSATFGCRDVVGSVLSADVNSDVV